MPEAYEDALNPMAQKFYETMGPGVQTASMTAKPDIVAGLRGALRELTSRGFRVVKTVPNSPGELDERQHILGVALAAANEHDGNATVAVAHSLLNELDELSPDPTIRRLQRTLVEVMSGEPEEWNLGRATMICDEIEGLLRVQGELKRAFKNDELDGGWKTALEHPLYLQAEARKASLHDELKGLI